MIFFHPKLIQCQVVELADCFRSPFIFLIWWYAMNKFRVSRLQFLIQISELSGVKGWECDLI